MTPNSAIQFLIWLLIVASLIAVVASRLRIPYTIALVMGGLALGSFHRLPAVQSLTEGRRPNWLTPEVILILFLPPLLFEGAIKVRARHLRENLLPILLLASLGVLVATLITGLAVHWAFGLPLIVALLFGSIIASTDPISVLSVFEETGVGKRLSMIVEGESLFNDGAAVVLFAILLAGVSSGHLSVAAGLAQFVIVVLGAVALGSLLGYVISKITSKIDDPRVEITLTTILAYGSYLTAQSLHLSGVIATVAAGIVLGNFGANTGMSPRTRMFMWSFWAYAAFVINSLLFLLIGTEVRMGDLVRDWHAAALAISAVLLGRVLSVYGLTSICNMFAERIPLRWQHVLVWGGLRGALSLALVLSLDPAFPYQADLLAWTFGVVAFSLIVQGLTIKPLLRVLGLTATTESEFDRAKVRQMSLSSVRTELDELLKSQVISEPLHARFRRELDASIEQTNAEIAEIYTEDTTRAQVEMRAARARLRAAEEGAIQRAFYDGLISQRTTAEMIDAADRRMDALAQRVAAANEPLHRPSAVAPLPHTDNPPSRKD